MTLKRKDYISWDEYFMGVAKLSALRSKDPSTQVGACIVNDDNRILTVGYNGFPKGCSDDDFPWEREGGTYDSKYAYVCHAELNAILNCGTADLKNTRVYVTLFPCENCTKALIQKGIKEIIYDSDKYHDTDGCKAARRMLDSAGVIYKQYDSSSREITIDV
ncbi:MAG: dCMP deaminase family protein [Saccharofermentans sp.]|nr:dCMP deaminase family protein [Saccharofermentans sp.]